ncbi:hypothetical protein GO730_01895 [Spirosoma sp. HMF3257]|uniref:Right handed beta helix domain-containing protein n=1 Tax=Spirosoma telluris TaxID=2183553 RepID=A0A327NUR1_9BACT|nr:hypothetical protein [Spirosoma telluris]RAI78313.1 hypothetical protein HMF3257_01865 [Spirosoma telluris]
MRQSNGHGQPGVQRKRHQCQRPGGGNVRPHHIALTNNTAHDCGGAGISAIESDYVTVENNTVYNNSWYTIFGTSGISFLNSWNYDTNADTPKMIIRNNICYGNGCSSNG